MIHSTHNIDNVSKTISNLSPEGEKNPAYFSFYTNGKSIRNVLKDGNNYIVIGDNEVILMGIDSKTKQIVTIDEAEQDEARLVNSSLDNLVSSLDLYYSFQEIFESGSDEEMLRATKKIKMFLESNDKKALEDGNFWAEFIEEKEMMLEDE